MRYTTVFFDLGSTLLYSKDAWPPIYALADQQIVTTLRQAGIDIDPSRLHQGFATFLEAYYAERGSSLIEKTFLASLTEMFTQKGYGHIPVALLHEALAAMYAVTQLNWYLEEDALPTLAFLRQQGYRLGLISNTSDDRNVQQLVDRFGLRSNFETIITSAGCGFRKPDKRIFLLALEKLQVLPGESVMVGDTLEADVLGANQLGFYSIWITHHAAAPPEGLLEIQPQAIVSRLNQIPGLLHEIEKNPTEGLA